MTTTNDARRAALVSTLVLGAVLAPLRQNWRAAPRDGFPLSYYPMFSAKRRARVAVHSLVAVQADGTRTRLPHRLCGSGGGNQVRKLVVRAAEGGRGEQLCAEVAARLDPSVHGAVVAVQLVLGRYHLDRCFVDGRLRGRETVLASVDCSPRTPVPLLVDDPTPDLLDSLALVDDGAPVPAEATGENVPEAAGENVPEATGGCAS